jgi:trans-aconitate 2-methyltransferase
MTAPQWDPAQYSRFEAQRDRAALDLLLRLPENFAPREIWDLGCGTGQHAALMKRRHPEAGVHGMDSSAAMLDQARALSDAVDWSVGDIATWAPERPVDLIFANASLQWLPEHAPLFRRLAEALGPGGVLAVQMPLSRDTQHHRLMRETLAEEPWASLFADVTARVQAMSSEAYYDVLAPLCDDVDIWSTTYLHVLAGENAVLEWMKGTALRPYLTALDGDSDAQDAFLAA